MSPQYNKKYFLGTCKGQVFLPIARDTTIKRLTWPGSELVKAAFWYGRWM